MEQPQQEQHLQIVYSRPEKVPEGKLKENALIDLVVLLEKEDEECLEKQLGKLHDQRNGQEYHLEENKP